MNKYIDKLQIGCWAKHIRAGIYTCSHLHHCIENSKLYKITIQYDYNRRIE